jgi:hypothetical protein
MSKKLLKPLYVRVKKWLLMLRAVSKISVKDLLKNEPVYLFNHIPKCGGTSLTRILENWFVVVRDYPPHDLNYPDLILLNSKFNHFRDNPLNLIQIRPWQLVAGHYHEEGVRLGKRYPNALNNKRYRLITFLRDPLEQKISLFYYGNKRGHNFVKGYTLKEYIFNDININFYANALGCSIDNYKEIIDSYFFVGVLEYFETSIEILSNRINRSFNLNIPQSNISKRDEQELNINKADNMRFQELNHLDYLIYKYAVEKLEL